MYTCQYSSPHDESHQPVIKIANSIEAISDPPCLFHVSSMSSCEQRRSCWHMTQYICICIIYIYIHNTFICLSIYLSINLSIYASINLSIYILYDTLCYSMNIFKRDYVILNVTIYIYIYVYIYTYHFDPLSTYGDASVIFSSHKSSSFTGKVRTFP